MTDLPEQLVCKCRDGFTINGFGELHFATLLVDLHNSSIANYFLEISVGCSQSKLSSNMLPLQLIATLNAHVWIWRFINFHIVLRDQTF